MPTSPDYLQCPYYAAENLKPNPEHTCDDVAGKDMSVVRKHVRDRHERVCYLCPKCQDEILGAEDREEHLPTCKLQKVSLRRGRDGRQTQSSILFHKVVDSINLSHLLPSTDVDHMESDVSEESALVEN